MARIRPDLIRRVAATGAAAALLMLGAWLPGARGADADPSAGVAFFEAKIRPVLARRCYTCHGGPEQAKGGLKLDTRARLRTGGSSGPPIDLDEPENSLILAALRYEGPQMPPVGKLPADVVNNFAAWIKMGAPDPRDNGAKRAVPGPEIDFATARKAWAYTAPQRHEAPAVRDGGWPRGTIDRFILARQEAAGVRPAPDAPAAVWLRRVSFDLAGLPPTVEQIEAIERDDSPAARAAVVDALLASPAFGERWARHWMDVARFAESTGSDKNYIFPQAWRYRDWVIDALNADMPYDRFVRVQVAGDLEPASSPAQADAQAIATGFLALVPRLVDERVRELYLLNVVDEQIDNIGRGILGLSVACARCHDHKYDPIPTTDYYALAGILRNSETRDGLINRVRNGGETSRLVALAAAPRDGAEAIRAATSEAVAAEKAWSEKRSRFNHLRQQAAAIRGASPDSPAPAVSADELKAMDHEVRVLAALQDEKKSALARLTAYTLAAALVDRPHPADAPVRYRGEVDQIGPVIPRGYLTLLARPDDPRPGLKGSGRRALAAWLTRPDNPLTARVIVNRLWSKLFGVGIVATVDDFGSQGDPPSHPELLDELATRFVADGWSIKRAVRAMVLSRTYGLADRDDPASRARDENNILLWRWNRRRLDAEVLRDAMLAASGRLDRSRPVASPTILLGVQELGRRKPDQKTPVTDYTPLETPSLVRSVYLPVVRNKLTEPMAAFDAADPSLIVGRRDATTSPTQGLYILNSSFVIAQAEQLARNLLAESSLDDPARVERAYLTVLARRPTAAERDCALRFLTPASSEVLSSSVAERLGGWMAFAQALIALPEFRYVF